MDDADAGEFDDLDGEIDDLLNEEDIMIAAEMLEPNSSAAMLVFENVWADTAARRYRQRQWTAGGQRTHPGGRRAGGAGGGGHRGRVTKRSAWMQPA